ncbi:hypothetical protein [Bosea sp. BIWAKO-01]|uniref:hypothetical protein n=1 Tax=Bosea sp. BIWAKO-01 TaxID=506668 RepID=UPI00086EE94D|nr:hypothetical protein [Bosea sp. BIWAKO-01]GAU85960.1 hypothetical protein BIWAKO_05908 [Bosea sp. BIWAKO-01]
MKAFALSVALAVASGAALAQTTPGPTPAPAPDPMTHLRSCSLMGPAERLECLDKLSRRLEPAAERPAPGGDNWILSETTSPVNYSPIVTATASARGGSDGALSQLAIHCRGGRTELVVTGPALAKGGTDYTISYRVNDGQSVQVAAAQPSFGSGVSFRGDVAQLLLALPDEGDLAIRLSARVGPALDGSFALGGLKRVREKVASACNWPGAIARPRSP